MTSFDGFHLRSLQGTKTPVPTDTKQWCSLRGKRLDIDLFFTLKQEPMLSTLTRDRSGCEWPISI